MLSSPRFERLDVYAPNPWHFDVLIASGELDIPAWQDNGPCDPAISGCDMTRFVLPVPPAGLGPSPPTGVRLRDLLALDSLEEVFKELVIRDDPEQTARETVSLIAAAG